MASFLIVLCLPGLSALAKGEWSHSLEPSSKSIPDEGENATDRARRIRERLSTQPSVCEISAFGFSVREMDPPQWCQTFTEDPISCHSAYIG